MRAQIEIIEKTKMKYEWKCVFFDDDLQESAFLLPLDPLKTHKSLKECKKVAEEWIGEIQDIKLLKTVVRSYLT